MAAFSDTQLMATWTASEAAASKPPAMRLVPKPGLICVRIGVTSLVETVAGVNREFSESSETQRTTQHQKDNEQGVNY